ncbi:MAG: hypothetical protein H0W72_05840 [Planctomycetes bacterium]|nr:hypothetical protein [Planctomycetota bacterium]
MPVEGLPDPTIHRKCKRCGLWCHLHEGTRCWPPKTGLLTVVHVSLAQGVDNDQDMKFYCAPCQERNALDERRFRKVTVSSGITIIVLGIALPLAWWVGAFAWLERMMRSGY